MAKTKATMHNLSYTLTMARRYYAAGDKTRAEAALRMFKQQAQEVHVAQQEDMAREMTRHLKLRGELHDITKQASDLAREVKGEGDGR